MSRLLPSLPDSTPDDREPRVIGVEDDEADALIAALGSETARDLLSSLHEEPATTSELATELETSLQNVQYHLRRLSDADLVEVVDTAYSEKGREMNVYAPADEPLVLFAGGSTDSGGLKTALKRLLGGYGVIALGALMIQQLFAFGVFGADDAAVTEDAEFQADEDVAATDDAEAAEDAAEPTPAPEEAEDAAETGITDLLAGAVDALVDAVAALEPSVALFLVAAVAFTTVWTYRNRSLWVRST